MKYACETVIDRPRDEVVARFDNPENLKHWLLGLESFEPLSGTPGQVGAKSKLVFTKGKRRMEMVETITVRNLPEEFSGTYEMPGVLNLQANRFLALEGGRTKWEADCEFRFSGWFLKALAFVFPGMFKTETKKYMAAFKKFAETAPR